MNKQTKIVTSLIDQKASKIELASAFVWFHFASTGTELTLNEINEYFVKNDLAKYNPTYLKEALRKCKDVSRDSKIGTYRPLRSYIEKMNIKFPFVEVISEDILTDDTIIPNILVVNTRGYIINLANQINGSYEHNVFDGCAVLMRRLLEIMLIHSYESNGRISDIQDVEGFRNLSYIINFTISNKPFSLSKEVAEVLNDFRHLGNFSAHKIQFNCKRKDIDNIKLKYRLAIEELLYASAIKK